MTRHQSHIYRLACRITGCSDTARDITQDTLIKAYHKLSSFNLQHSFRNWTLAIATNLCLDILRRQKSHMKYVTERQGMHRELVETRTAENSTLHPGPVFHLIGLLSRKERLALLLRVEEELSLKEIAQAIGCSDSTARVHLFNARQKLKKALQKNGFGGEKR